MKKLLLYYLVFLKLSLVGMNKNQLSIILTLDFDKIAKEIQQLEEQSNYFFHQDHVLNTTLFNNDESYRDRFENLKNIIVSNHKNETQIISKLKEFHGSLFNNFNQEDYGSFLLFKKSIEQHFLAKQNFYKPIELKEKASYQKLNIMVSSLQKK